MPTLPASTATLRTELLTFFDDHAREMPWRETADPYKVWVSEIMLQQTRVETVIPYYRRWVERFPTVSALAEAPLESVLEAWAGLGYYSRARNLHKAAGVVQEECGGEVPRDLNGLRRLPGVGEYTAGAVASIAFKAAVPAVDGNVRRVLSRLFDIEHPTAAALRTTASDLVDPARPGDFNQALMELGATICTPRAPRCSECPVVRRCGAFAADTVHLRPPTRPARKVPSVSYAVAVVRFWVDAQPWTLLRRRPWSGLLAGMLEFPSVLLAEASATAANDPSPESENVAWSGLSAISNRYGPQAHALDPVAHRFSHLAATYFPYVFDVPEEPEILKKTDATLMRMAWKDLGGAALPAAQRRIARAAARTLSNRRQS